MTERSLTYNRGLAHAVDLNQACRFDNIIVAGAMPNVFQPQDIYQAD